MTIEEQLAALTARVEALEAELSKKRRSTFKPPTEAEVLAYANSKGKVIDARHFIDHYESKGWMVGKVKMRRWQSAVSNWIRNAPKFEPTPTPEQLAQRNSALVNSNIPGWLE